MKKLLLTFLALAAGFLPLAAQDWTPFRMGQTPYFQAGDSVYSLRLNSVQVVAGDSVFEFNPRAVPFGSYIAFVSKNNLFGHQMLKNNSGDYRFVFEPADTFLLKPYSPAGTTWQFSAAPLLLATLQNRTAAFINGQPDSVATVALSNGNEILLSKNYGIVSSRSFYSYLSVHTSPAIHSLKRLPEAGLGNHLTGVFNIFDFNPGDKFLYTYKLKAYGAHCKNVQTTIEIISRTINTAGTLLQYDLKRQDLTTYFGSPPTIPCYGAAPQELTALFDDVLEITPDYPFFYILEPVEPQELNSLSREHAQFSQAPSGQPLLNTGQFQSLYNQRWASGFEAKTYDSISGAYTGFSYGYEVHFAEGLGIISATGMGLDYEYTLELTAYIKGNETYGSWQPLVLSAEENLAQNLLQVYPNPFTNKLTIKLPELQTGSAEATLYNLQGQKIHASEVNIKGEETELQLPGLPAGLYLLMVQQGEKSYSVKVQKQ